MTSFKGLDNFKRKLAQAEKIRRIGDVILEEGKTYAKMQYASHSHNDIIIYDTANADMSELSIVAQDTSARPKIAYYEYGTGKYAKGMYEGNLPTFPITFVSAGKIRTTNGWEYYYKNTTTKPNYPNNDYWIVANGFKSRGNMPEMEMYSTSKYLKQNVLEIVRKGWKKL
jgi:hypothetical protein